MHGKRNPKGSSASRQGPAPDGREGAPSWTPSLALDASRRVASFAAITDAKDEAAQSFYEYYGFQLLPTERQDRRLFLPMGTVERLFAE